MGQGISGFIKFVSEKKKKHRKNKVRNWEMSNEFPNSHVLDKNFIESNAIRSKEMKNSQGIRGPSDI